jgi:hypothetical protein
MRNSLRCGLSAAHESRRTVPSGCHIFPAEHHFRPRHRRQNSFARQNESIMSSNSCSAFDTWAMPTLLFVNNHASPSCVTLSKTGRDAPSLKRQISSGNGGFCPLSHATSRGPTLEAILRTESLKWMRKTSPAPSVIVPGHQEQRVSEITNSPNSSRVVECCFGEIGRQLPRHRSCLTATSIRSTWCVTWHQRRTDPMPAFRAEIL